MIIKVIKGRTLKRDKLSHWCLSFLFALHVASHDSLSPRVAYPHHLIYASFLSYHKDRVLAKQNQLTPKSKNVVEFGRFYAFRVNLAS